MTKKSIIERLAQLLLVIPKFGVEAVNDAIEFIDTMMPDWISVEECLPPEQETIFAKLKGTGKWRSTMFTRMSDDVRIVIEQEDGTRKVHHSYTVDGKWNIEEHRPLPCRVLYWMPNPPMPEDLGKDDSV